MIYVTLILGAFAGFIAFWAGIVSLIGFAGWKPLVERFPARYWPEGEGQKFSWQSGSVGLSNYNNALNGVVTADGLYLKPAAIFKFNHDPLFIPWEAVEGLDDRWFGGVALDLGDRSIRLSGKLAKAIRQSYAAWEERGPRTHRPLFDEPESDLLGPDGDTLSDETLDASGWRRHRTR